jgi:hypothetical protein
MNITLLAIGALPTTGVDLVKKVVSGQSALSLAVVPPKLPPNFRRGKTTVAAAKLDTRSEIIKRTSNAA